MYVVNKNINIFIRVFLCLDMHDNFFIYIEHKFCILFCYTPTTGNRAVLSLMKGQSLLLETQWL